MCFVCVCVGGMGTGALWRPSIAVPWHKMWPGFLSPFPPPSPLVSGCEPVGRAVCVWHWPHTPATFPGCCCWIPHPLSQKQGKPVATGKAGAGGCPHRQAAPCASLFQPTALRLPLRASDHLLGRRLLLALRAPERFLLPGTKAGSGVRDLGLANSSWFRPGQPLIPRAVLLPCPYGAQPSQAGAFPASLAWLISHPLAETLPPFMGRLLLSRKGACPRCMPSLCP